jgi:hypothetical protein
MGDPLAYQVEWLNTFATLSAPVASCEVLFDGVALLEALSEIDTSLEVSAIKRDVGENWPLAAKNIRLYVSQLGSYYEEELQVAADLSYVDVDSIARDHSTEGLRDLVALLIGCVLQSTDVQEYVGRIMSLDEESQGELQEIAREAMERFDRVEEDTPRSRSPSPDAEPAASTAQGETERGFRGFT